ncbi:hypothetical protein ACFXTH_001215 [Malus domestica]
MAEEGSDVGLAGGSDRGVQVVEAFGDAIEHFGKVRGQRVVVGFEKDGHHVDALLADRKLVRGVDGLYVGEENGYGHQVEGSGDGFEFRSCEGICVAIEEFIQADEDSVLEVLGGRHCG